MSGEFFSSMFFQRFFLINNKREIERVLLEGEVFGDYFVIPKRKTLVYKWEYMESYKNRRVPGVAKFKLGKADGEIKNFVFLDGRRKLVGQIESPNISDFVAMTHHIWCHVICGFEWEEYTDISPTAHKNLIEKVRDLWDRIWGDE